MNKINKFRGQAITGEWLYGSLIVFGERTFIYPKNGSQEDYHFYGYEVKPNTVGQFIGRNDKNGIEIFTGDILPAADGFGLLPVCFNYDKFSLYFKGYGNVEYNWTDFEIKGNIFNNPELLESAN